MPILASLAFALLTSSPAQTQTIASFDVVVSEDTEHPRGKVYLVVGEKRVLVKTVTGGTSGAPDEKPAWVPKNAVAFVSTWYAGQGDQFYALRKGKGYRVYHRGIDEETTPGKFRLVKSVKA